MAGSIKHAHGSYAANYSGYGGFVRSQYRKNSSKEYRKSMKEKFKAIPGIILALLQTGRKSKKRGKKNG